jgi:CO dehydrogenase maturation factor
VRTVARIIELVDELKLIVRRQSVIINQVPDGLDPMVAEELKKLGIKSTATIPQDEELVKYDIQMKPLLEMPDSSKAVRAVGDLMTNLLSVKEAK